MDAVFSTSRQRTRPIARAGHGPCWDGGVWHLLGLLLAERDRWFLWTPVGLALGIGVYFALPVEPPPWLGAVLVVAGAGILLMGRRWQPLVALCLCGLVIVLGFSAAQWRARSVAAPILEKPVRGQMAGTVLKVENRPTRVRITVAPDRIGRLRFEELPRRVRVVLLPGEPLPRVGDQVVVRVVLRPPAAPVGPGAYDFQRAAYFQQLGGVGFATSRLSHIEPSGVRSWSMSVAVSFLRQKVSEAIRAAVPGQAGAIASAMLAGDRSGISEETMASVRHSGLAHLLAISGLHMGLVAGFVFFVLRFGLAAWPWIALRFPVKKHAALGAMLFAAVYLALSGGSVPTQRAFLMTALVLLAVMIDRTAISLRTVAWAAIAILLLVPESLLSASFQLSFAAVVPLVAAYEALRERGGGWRAGGEFGVVRKALLYVGMLILTSLIANFATAPFAAHHFNQVNTLGVAANLLAVPLTGFWIMPLGVTALVLMPFGLEHLALIPMSWGVDGLLMIAETVSARPESVIAIARGPVTALVVVALAGLWLCLWRRPWRLAAVPVLLVAVLWMGSSTPPSVMIAGDGRLVGVRLADGTMALSTLRSSKFEASAWMRHAAVTHARWWFQEDGTRIDRPSGLSCDSMGCLLRQGPVTIGLPMTGEGAWEDCQRAAAVITPDRLFRSCSGPNWVIDRRNLRADGAHAIWISETGIRVETVRERRGERPWVSR